MKRAYTHVKMVEKEIIEMKQAGKTNRGIAEHFGFADKWVVKRWVKGYNKRKKEIEAGIAPRRRGRPAKGYVAAEKEMENEIKRLRMENTLLRDFLRIAGRR
jgi:hypothetical protein